MIRLVCLLGFPIYLLQVKGFSKAEMSVAFLFFEWAAIPSTILAGYISDKFFKRLSYATSNYRCKHYILLYLFGYWQK